MSHEFQPPGSLPRPGPIARWTRVFLAILTLLFLVPAVPGLLWMTEHRRPIPLEPVEVLVPLMGTIWLIPSATQLLGWSGKRVPRIALLAVLGVLGAWSWLSSGDPLGPILAMPALFSMIGLLLLLSISFLLAALFAVPG
jgi:hypothetical protein